MLSEQDFTSIITVYNTGSFHKASEALFISQPALSKSINTLERSLNIQLFERSKKGVKPTPACEMLIPLAKQIIEQINGFKIMCASYALCDNPVLSNTPITISSYPSIISEIIPELFSLLKLHVPNFNYVINDLDIQKTIPIPNENEVIIYIERTNLEKSFPESIANIHICTIEPVVCLHKDYINPMPKFIDEKELVNFPIITIAKDQIQSSILTSSVINHLLTIRPQLNIINVTNNSIANFFVLKKLGVSLGLRMNSSVVSNIHKDMIYLPLHYTNPDTFSFSICYSNKIPQDLIGIIVNLIKYNLHV